MKLIYCLFAVTLLLHSCTTTTTTEKSEIIPSQTVYLGKQAAIYTTAKDTEHRLSLTDMQIFQKADQALETEIAIFVNPTITFQEFLGIGGAITDASAEVYDKLSEQKKAEFIDAYYGENGINYSLLRTTIHSCDFGSESYTYIEEGDSALSTFSIERDKLLRIPMIHDALNNSGIEMPVYVSPWSPPAFMKSNKNMLQGGKLLPKYSQSWANYYCKFIKAYEKEGIPIWGLTIQNEPMATQRWESCIYTAEEERDFLKNYLGPTLEKQGLQDKKIVVWDHNRDLITHRANTIFDDPEASKYAWGIGFHWYETWTGADPNYESINRINQSYPDKKLLFTEGCNEAFNPEKYQYWPNAERYGSSMINDFNRGTVGWTDWNILLDHTGGPNHVQNFCFAPIHADTRTDELIFTPTYFYLGHFSKFIRPGAKRVSTTSSRNYLLSTTFQNTENMVTVVMNGTDEAISYKLIVEDSEIELNIAPHAIQTIVY